MWTMLMRPHLEHPLVAGVEIGALAIFERALPSLGEYDTLLAGSLAVAP
jgi:hypothetical protein